MHEHKAYSCAAQSADYTAFLLTGDQEIKALKVMCNNYGCGWTGELRSLNKHLTTCGYALLPCTNKCTNNTEKVYMFLRDMDNHLKNTCPNRQYQCPHCKETGRHCEITTTHLDTCPKIKIPCPNVGCDDSVPRCELSDHQTECLFEKVPCKYAGIGCKEEPLRKDLQQHENDYMLHLQLAVETVNKLHKEMRAMEPIMEDNIVHTQASPWVFIVPKFNELKTVKQDWYSLPFYIHPGSYKMCINVTSNGHGDGEDTHISVYVYLMCGRNDDNLSWPFRGEVTITLLNQLEDKNHHTEMIMYTSDEDGISYGRRVLDSDWGTLGYGWATFVSHDRLGYDAEQNCQYLKDDCLYFRITATAPDPVKPWLTCTPLKSQYETTTNYS